MFGKKCPNCGVKLGDYLYADACPHCHEVLKRNLADPAPLTVAKVQYWPVRAFFSVRDFVES
jgi:predicted amidophosphoribosyltransferase